MRQQDNHFFELLSLVKPEPLIRIIEHGLEVEKLLNADSEELNDAIHYSNALLTFLRLHRLGLH